VSRTFGKWALIAVALACMLIQARPAEALARVRRPAAAGLFYPLGVDALRTAVETYLDQAEVPTGVGRVKACLAPIDGYPVCGQVAAHAFRALEPGKVKRVIALTASHHAEFNGVSAPSVLAFRTPLGDVPVDHEAVESLRLC